MKELRWRLEQIKKNLKAEVEAERIEDLLVNRLVQLFPLNGGRDKMHFIWARALRDNLWLGWLSEAKHRRSLYDDRIYNAIEESLRDAFEIGRQHAIEQP